MQLRWGIASAGMISNDFAAALSTLPTEKHIIIVVAARNLEAAKKFATKFKIQRAYGSYEELAIDPDVDIVYVGTINPIHHRLCTLMIKHKKHVLCETPMCLNEGQTLKLVRCAQRNNVFLMEGNWLRFLPSYKYLREQVSARQLGKIRDIDCTIGLDMSFIPRITKNRLGGGCLLDKGIFQLQLGQWVFRCPPKKIKATGKLNNDGVDIEVNAEIIYTNGAKLIMSTNSQKGLQNRAYIRGSKAQIVMNEFWCGVDLLDVNGSKKSWDLPESKYKTNYRNTIGLFYEAIECRKCIMEGKNESEFMTHDDSLELASIRDDIRRQIGVYYDADEKYNYNRLILN